MRLTKSSGHADGRYEENLPSILIKEQQSTSTFKTNFLPAYTAGLMGKSSIGFHNHSLQLLGKSMWVYSVIFLIS